MIDCEIDSEEWWQQLKEFAEEQVKRNREQWRKEHLVPREKDGEILEQWLKENSSTI
jgi:hypothetical protein